MTSIIGVIDVFSNSGRCAGIRMDFSGERLSNVLSGSRFVQNREAELANTQLRASDHQWLDLAEGDAGIGPQANFEFGGLGGGPGSVEQLLFDGRSRCRVIAEQPRSLGRNGDRPTSRRRGRTVGRLRRLRQLNFLAGIAAD